MADVETGPDRPDSKTEVEITSEMIEAGTRAYAAYGLEDVEFTVWAIYQEMRRAIRRPALK